MLFMELSLLGLLHNAPFGLPGPGVRSSKSGNLHTATTIKYTVQPERPILSGNLNSATLFVRSRLKLF